MFPYRFSSRGGFKVNDLRGKTLPFHKLWFQRYKFGKDSHLYMYFSAGGSLNILSSQTNNCSVLTELYEYE